MGGDSTYVGGEDGLVVYEFLFVFSDVSPDLLLNLRYDWTGSVVDSSTLNRSFSMFDILLKVRLFAFELFATDIQLNAGHSGHETPDFNQYQTKKGVGK